MKTLGSPADAVDVMFFDVPKHDWATAGVLASDRAATPPADPKP